MSKKFILIILGTLAVLVALPVAFFAEIGLNGCCGAPSTGHEGYGYILGAGLFILGIYLMVIARKK